MPELNEEHLWHIFALLSLGIMFVCQGVLWWKMINTGGVLIEWVKGKFR